MNGNDKHIARTAFDGASVFIGCSDYSAGRVNRSRVSGGGTNGPLSVKYNGIGMRDELCTCDINNIELLSLREVRDVLSILITELAGACGPNTRIEQVPQAPELPTAPDVPIVKLSFLLTSIVAARDHLTARIAESA